MAEPAPQAKIRVSILSENEVLVNGAKTPPLEVGQKLKGNGVASDILVRFSINGDLPYRFVSRVMGQISKAGYSRLSVVEVK